MSKKSVLIVDPVGRKAGMDFYDASLASALNAQGVATWIASNFQGRGDTFQVFFSDKDDSKLLKLRDLLKGLFTALKKGRQLQAEYVLLHMFSAELKDLLTVLLFKLFGFKIMLVTHDISGFAGTDRAWIKKTILNRLSDLLIVHNAYSCNALRQEVLESRWDRIHVIPHGSYLSLKKSVHNDATQARKQLGLEPSDQVILFFGQIKKVKGLDLLIESLSQVQSNVVLVIAGKPWKDDFLFYEKLIARHSLEKRVRLFIRFIPDEERDLLFRAADLLVVPYRKIYQSGVLLMGMSYGLPVLASDLPANLEIIRNGENGLLFTTEQVNSLASQIDYFFEQGPGFRQSLAERSEAYLQTNHNWSDIARSYKNIME